MGAPSDIPSPPLNERLSYSGFKKEEYIRLILQTLHELGYSNSAKLLENESGFQYETQSVSDLRESILAGHWEKAEALISSLGIKEKDRVSSAKYMLKKQHYLELLESRQMKEALHVLRNEIAPLGCESQELHELSTLMMCSSAEALYKKAGWTSPLMARRAEVYEKFQDFVPSSLVIPPHRLEQLIRQAVNRQKDECVYHTTDDCEIQLYSDHQCSVDDFPKYTTHILDEHHDEVWFVAFSHNGKYLASASKDASVIVWRTSDWQSVYHLNGHEESVSFLSWSLDDTMLLSCGNDKKVRLWNIVTGDLLKVFTRHTEPVTSCAWFPDNKRFVTGGLDKVMNLWSIDGNHIQRWSGVRITDLAVTHDGLKIISVCTEKKIRLYDVNDKSESFLGEEHLITSLSLSADSKYALVNVAASEIHLWDIEKKKIVSTYSGQKQGTYVIRSSFGGVNQSFIISGSEDCNVYIWHRDKKVLLESLSGHSGTVNSVSWNPQDAGVFASASDDCTIRIWGKLK